jgi:CheY-like chemotaxis protein
VSLATTSQEVLDLVAEDDSFFDAVVLDNWMPPTTGIETCKLIRIIDQKTLSFSVPVRRNSRTLTKQRKPEHKAISLSHSILKS